MHKLTKARVDAWDAELTDAQRWQVYDLMRSMPWYNVAEWCTQTLSIDAPSRSGLYRFAKRMRSLESARRVESALLARDEAGALVACQTDDSATIAAYKAMAQDLALAGNTEQAVAMTKMALDLASQMTKARELEIKAKAQATKDAQLKLAQDKFEAAERRLGDIEETVADEQLSAEQVTARIKSIFGIG